VYAKSQGAGNKNTRERDRGLTRRTTIILGKEERKFIHTLIRERKEPGIKPLRVQGFGTFYLKDKYILIKAPFINEPEIWTGFLEGLLCTELDIKTITPPLVFELKTVKN